MYVIGTRSTVPLAFLCPFVLSTPWNQSSTFIAFLTASPSRLRLRLTDLPSTRPNHHLRIPTDRLRSRKHQTWHPRLIPHRIRVRQFLRPCCVVKRWCCAESQIWLSKRVRPGFQFARRRRGNCCGGRRRPGRIGQIEKVLEEDGHGCSRVGGCCCVVSVYLLMMVIEGEDGEGDNGQTCTIPAVFHVFAPSVTAVVV